MILNILLITSASFNICVRNSTYIAFEYDTSLLFNQIDNLYNLKENEKYINLENKINFFAFATKKEDLNYINNCNKEIYNFIYPYIYEILNSEYKTIISKALYFFSENSKLQFLESYKMNNSSVSGKTIYFDTSYKIKRNSKYHKIVKIISKNISNIELFDKFIRNYCKNKKNYILFYYLLTEKTIENNLNEKKNEINKNFKRLTNYFNLLLCNFNNGPIDFNLIIDLKYKILLINIIKKYLGIAFNISPNTFSFTINKKTKDFSKLKIEKNIKIKNFREISDNLEIGSKILINLIKNKIKDENYQIIQDDNNYKIIKNFTVGDNNKSFLVFKTNKTSFKDILKLFTVEEISDILIIFGKNEYKIEKNIKNEIYKIISKILNEIKQGSQ